jgi:UDP-N-acetylglucosamine:LPS N-acetylglucosamine transferase
VKQDGSTSENIETTVLEILDENSSVFNKMSMAALDSCHSDAAEVVAREVLNVK